VSDIRNNLLKNFSEIGQSAGEFKEEKLSERGKRKDDPNDSINSKDFFLVEFLDDNDLYFLKHLNRNEPLLEYH
jgi:hypothetical protein